MMLKILVQTSLFFLVGYVANGQSGVQVSFANTLPHTTESEFDLEVYAEIRITNIKDAANFIVAIEKTGDNPEIVMIENSRITTDANGFYYVGEQCVFNTATVKSVNAFRKNEILENHQLMFYVVDKDGVKSASLTFPLKQ